MSNHYAYQTHGLYRNLVSDIVNSLKGSEWEMEKEVMGAMHSIPSGIRNMLIHLAVTDTGLILVNVTENGNDLVKWLLDSASTGITNVDHGSIMSIGRLQHSFECFWDQYISKCTRVDMQHKRGTVRANMIGNRSYFADRVVRSWLERGRLDLYIMPGEIRIGEEVYHTNRSWRRNVRELAGMSARHEDTN